MNLRDKIKMRFEKLEADLKAGKHMGSLEGRFEMVGQLESISKFCSILDDGERDTVNAARYAIRDMIEWR